MKRRECGKETKRGREGMLEDLLRLLGRRLCVPLECISFSGISSSSSENERQNKGVIKKYETSISNLSSSRS